MSVSAEPAGLTHAFYCRPAGEFGVLAFAAAPAGRQALSGPTLITHYSV